MRLVGSFTLERDAFRFHSYLKSIKIDNKYEEGHVSAGVFFHIWIINEDDFSKASELFEEFSRNSVDPKFDVHTKVHFDLKEEKILPQEESLEESIQETKIMRLASIKKTFCTRWLISLCIILFIWNAFDRYQWIQAHKSEENQLNVEQIPLMPLEKALLYDDPDLTSTRGIWQGYYTQLFPAKETTVSLAPLTFGKIAHGEVWRLVTPAFLHGGILHILFNMLWLWILGKQVEEKIGSIRYLLMILLIAALSNTAQYLMSGFSFVGFSGIICGLAGYIWIRQKTAPWEGYALQRGTLGFLMVFVLGIAALQCLTFGLQYFQVANIQLPVANTAHLVGAFSGIILARIPGFSK